MARWTASAVALAAALLVSGTCEVDARADATSDLEKAHSAYLARAFGDAETRLRALLDAKAGTLKTADEIADARMYLGAVLVAEDKKDEAAAIFEQLLSDKPDYQPDPLRVSLEAVDALIDVRARLRDRLATIQTDRVHHQEEERAKTELERHRAALRLEMLEKLASEQVVVEHNSRWKALVPFGVGQFQNGQDALGWLLVSSESLAVLGSFAGAALTFYNVGQANDALARQDVTANGYQQRAQQAAVVGDVFAAGFALLAVVGVVQAEVAFVPERTRVVRRALPPLSLGPSGIGLRF